VANAGIAKAASIEDTQIEDFDNLFAVNVRAPFFLVQQLLPALCKGSNIIFTSSLAAHASVGALSAYGATKGAIDTLVKHFASALGPRGNPRQRRKPPEWWKPTWSNFVKTEARPRSRARHAGAEARGPARRHRPGGGLPRLDDARWITGDNRPCRRRLQALRLPP